MNKYISFVKLVKEKYPTPQIALLSSPMVNGDRGIKLQNCLNAVKQHIDAQFTSDAAVALFFFKPMEARGCTVHPSIEDHAILADEVTSFFKDLLSKR